MLTRRRALRTAGRDSGPNGATRIAVIMRDEQSCVRCGRFIVAPLDYSIHHRLPRGQGGGNQLSNLILLCGSATTGCHGYIETHRSEAYDKGWLVRRDADSTTVPILSGCRGLILLDNSGQWNSIPSD